MGRAVAAYYATREPFGAQGDFTTSPEISQAFGECLGAWAAVVWTQMGRPSPFLFAEIGPGRGTLMADALRAVGQVMPEFRRAAQVELVEASPRLRDMQRARLGAAVEAWRDDIAALPPGPAIILANEFFDALPIRQFIRRGGVWRERAVADGAFVEIDAEAPPPLPADAPEGAIQEVCEAARAIARALAQRLGAQGGAFLTLDYGPAERGFGDSLQAMRAHGFADPLADPGAVDLTAHVDFSALADAGRAGGAAVHGPLLQGIFLQRLGIMPRSALLARATPKRGAELLSAAQRLTAPEAMGRLFKALCLCHPNLPTPPGFETA